MSIRCNPEVLRFNKQLYYSSTEYIYIFFLTCLTIHSETNWCNSSFIGKPRCQQWNKTTALGQCNLMESNAEQQKKKNLTTSFHLKKTSSISGLSNEHKGWLQEKNDTTKDQNYGGIAWNIWSAGSIGTSYLVTHSCVNIWKWKSISESKICKEKTKKN